MFWLNKSWQWRSTYLLLSFGRFTTAKGQVNCFGWQGENFIKLAGPNLVLWGINDGSDLQNARFALFASYISLSEIHSFWELQNGIRPWSWALRDVLLILMSITNVEDQILSKTEKFLNLCCQRLITRLWNKTHSDSIPLDLLSLENFPTSLQISLLGGHMVHDDIASMLSDEPIHEINHGSLASE